MLSLYITRLGTVYEYFFNKKPQVPRFKIFLREKLYLKNSKIGGRREAGRIKKKALKFNKHFELDISL